jgi:hypothetical protein
MALGHGRSAVPGTDPGRHRVRGNEKGETKRGETGSEK